MRNLKRALSLALASIMVMGLMVVGSGASYKDVTSKQNQEAIEVLQTVGIMVGDDKGNFNPSSNVTRNEMAVIMANLMDYRVASYSGTSPFTDVPAWAEPYVAACYTNGITSGMGATIYGGDQTVTTAQAALMLMKALGYFQYQSDFEDDWMLATTKQGNKIDLFSDVDSGVREAMTRNDVAQLVLNTLECGTVEADNDTINVSTGDVTVSAGKVKYNYITSSKDYAYAIDSVLGSNTDASQISGSIVQLGEKLYNGDLKLRGTANSFGAPSSKWTYKNKEIGTYAETADYVFTGAVKSNAMYDAVGKNAASSDYNWVIKMDGTTTPSKPDGTALTLFTQQKVADNNKKDLAGTVRGSTTYIYVDDTSTKVNNVNYSGTVTVCIVNTYVAEITKVDDGTITLDDMDDPGLEFDIEGYDEGDVVLYTKSVNGNNWDVEAVLGTAQLVEGEVDTIRDEDRIVIDGTTYRYSYRFNNDNDDKLDTAFVNQTVSFYLDDQGNIIRFEDTAAALDYAYVYSVGVANSQFNDSDKDFGAKLVLTDGTVKSVILDGDTADEANNTNNSTTLSQVQGYWEHAIVSYSEGDDGTYTLGLRTTDALSTYATTKDDVVKNGSARVILSNGTNHVYADKNTVFLVQDSGEKADSFNAYVGYDNVPGVNATANSTKIATYVKSSTGVAKVIVITEAEVSGSAKDVIFVVGNPTAAVNKTGSTEYYVYDAVVDGEARSIKVKADSDAYDLVRTIASKEMGVYFGVTTNSNGYITNLTSKTPTDVQVNGSTNASKTTNVSFSEYVGTKRESNGGNMTFDTSNNPLSLAANKDAVIVYYDGSDLSITSRIKTDTDDRAIVVTDDGEIIAICVREFGHGVIGG